MCEHTRVLLSLPARASQTSDCGDLSGFVVCVVQAAFIKDLVVKGPVSGRNLGTPFPLMMLKSLNTLFLL